jgi:pyruvate dehydrogenase E2 component (dihydrolipoamide acetyltransferase)
MNPATQTAIEVPMPRLSDSMEEGTILAWLIEPGQRVNEGDDLVEIETDKANMTVGAEGSGVLEILAAVGDTLPVGAPIARLGSGPAAPPAADPLPPEPASPEPVPPRAEPAPAQRPAPAEVTATPLARRAARVHGVDLGRISAGSGPRGRIVKADVLAAAGVAPEQPRQAPPGPSPTAEGVPAEPAPSGARGESEVQEPSRLQAVIARRMAEAKATVPHFQVETEVRADAAIAMRAQLKGLAGEERPPSLNDLVVKAAATALRSHPKANASYRENRFELHSRINVGIAVAAEGALVVPTVFDADRKSLGEIGRESRRLAARVRTGAVTPPELAGGTFTVSNLGMLGMTTITPVINLPQAAILGVGAVRQVLVRGADGEIEDASLITLTLSCDHRILYGAEAAEFLREVKGLLEQPLRLVI